METYLTIRQAAQSGVAPESVIRKLVAQDRCPGVYSGKRFYVNIEMLKETLDAECKAKKKDNSQNKNNL